MTITRQWGTVDFRSWALTSLLLLVICGAANAAIPPVVKFDVAQTASCRTALPPECEKHRPSARVVEVVFDISTRIAAGKETDLKYITYEITSPGRQLSLAGYLPTTTLASETADGVINIEEHRSPAQLNLEYAGSQAKIQAPLHTPTDTKVVTKKLAPKSLLMASGTIDRSHGVFFTLHPSPQDSVQRTQQFVCYFEIPSDFRADYVQIACTAMAHNRALGRSDEAELPAGAARFNVGIYVEGDPEAKRAVDAFADRQQELLDAVAAERIAVANIPAHGFSPTAVYKSVLHFVRLDSSTTTTKPTAQGRESRGAKSNTGALRPSVTEARSAVESAMRTLRSMNGAELSSVR